MTRDPILAEVVRRTRAVFPMVERVLLFGSRARGDARTDSDYDLLVVTPTTLTGAERSVPLRLALRGLGASFDLIVVSTEEFDRLRASGGWWPREVLREAVVLHEAA